MPDFLKTCVAAKNHGFNTIRVDASVDKSWHGLALADGYHWRDWYREHDNSSNVDMLRAFRSIATQSPLFNPDDFAENVELFEVTFLGDSHHEALRAAAWHESPLVSFDSGLPWSTSPLTVMVNEIQPESGELESREGAILNFHTFQIFQQHLPSLIQARNAGITSGRELVQRLAEVYPGVELCGKALQQLNSWSASPTLLDQIKDPFAVMSQFARSWATQDGLCYHSDSLRENGLSFQVSGESLSVSQNPKLRKEREFYLPSGHKEFFEQHVKMSSGYRLHFYPDQNQRCFFVGYVGPHLRLK